MSFNGNKTGFFDTKDFRKKLLEKANERLGVIVKPVIEGNGTQVNKNSGLLSLLDSSYKSDTPSTVYAMHLKSIAFESARALAISHSVRDDIYFNTTRGEYFSQNIASFLFPNNRFPTTDKTDTSARNFYLSIIEAYFGGSTKANIERSLLRFLDGITVGISENYLLARGSSTFDPILNKFTFDISIDADDPRISDLEKIQTDIEFLINIIKPAHTSFSTKLIFNEFFDSFKGGCTLLLDDNENPVISHDGFEITIKNNNTSICDSFKVDLHTYFYEDIRKPCETPGVKLVENDFLQWENVDFETEEKLLTSESDPDYQEAVTVKIESIHQAAPRIARSIIGGNWNSSDPKEFHAKKGPFGKSTGELADSPNDIIAYVDGVQVDVAEIYPLSAAFVLVDEPPAGSVVTVTYYFITEYIGELLTNDPDSVLNNWTNSATEIDYKSVLPPTNYTPIGIDDEFLIWQESYRYKGFDLFNSSVLNCATSLNLNEAGLRSKFNDATVFKSFGYDQDIYIESLNEGTTPFPVTLDKKDVWRRLPHQQFRMNNTEFIMNTVEDRMFGETHKQSYHPFYSALEVETTNNGGNKGYLKPVCEDPVEGLNIILSQKYTEQYSLSDEKINLNANNNDYHLYTLNGFEKVNDNVNHLKDISKPLSLTFYTNYNVVTPDSMVTDQLFITTSTSITRVTNLTQGQDYVLTGLIMYGDRVFQLDESDLTNISIGISPTDIIQATYTAVDKMGDLYEVAGNIVAAPNIFEFRSFQEIKEIIAIYNIHKSSFYDLTDYSTVTASSGVLTSNNILITGTHSNSYQNTQSKWESVGSDDLTSETIEIDFNYPRYIDTLNLVGHNFGEFEISYFDGTTYQPFNNDINIENNTENSTFFTFEKVFAYKILISVTKTIIPNQEKYLTKFISLLENRMEVDYTSPINIGIGYDPSDVIYSNTIAKDPLEDTEFWMYYPKETYTRSITEF